MADDTGDGEVENERALELSTIAAIYPELRIESKTFSATLEICVEPITPLPIRFPTADGAPPAGLLTPPDSLSAGSEPVGAINQNNHAQDVHRLSHLPPLNIHFSLPEGYPAEKPPIVRLESQLSWLPEKKIQELCGSARLIWEDMGRDQMLFSYIDHVREAAEKGFGLVASEAQALGVSADLKVELLDYDLKARRAKFEGETFECGICLEPKKGTVCHRLLVCSHVFCVECLQDFYNTCITEGDIGGVKCLTPNCKAESGGDQTMRRNEGDKTLEPSELLQIPLEQEMVQRYIKLKRKNRLESDPTTIYCPRQWCQGPARCPNKKSPQAQLDMHEANDKPAYPEQYRFDRNTNQDLLPPPAERLAICEDCTFAFCSICKASWHGEFFVCFPRSQFELTAEERASEEYMKLHTQPCPTCDARAQKTHGCNHMICFKCKAHFCYLCGAYLHQGNPYTHYNQPKGGCYMRLWELEGGDGGEIGQAFVGGGGGGGGGGGEGGGGGGGGGGDILDDEDDDNALADQGQAGAARQNRGLGLRRFLQMVQNDEEDGWDSDEMDDAEDFQDL